ncbi:hypothetical protein GOPIP_070_00990 [Gordonia polyisoprenivorans NBRC 16320 = JCM 10675]|uniref:Uncharacterized protein n=1 Tax=Gordonia polyisoprenivorans TaxID=84595 RepID=A0A846WMR2_9ACTN|nr:hypothetical protein [Gordonia polyisoprenivorans]NKY02639.1 hypothetical protein [Gordonia polyisoprenivorans]OZC34060.1 hypothetical protein CJJ17_00825 [Gordonia polyisoprenivorans]GAB24620.1 hypothetical protein GOPIP_070_00990 [Gordonia polyisoprenivorans NBRC 16320 = JCM 10675]
MSGQPWSGDTRALAESLVPGCWPTTDDATLRQVATALAALRERLEHIAADLASAYRDVEGGDGRFTRAILAGREHLVGGEDAALPATARAVAAAADTVEAFADLTAAARLRVELVTAITDRDQMLGALAAALGDDTSAVRAASAGRMALTAAGDEYTEQSSALVQADPLAAGGGEHTDDRTGSSAGATSGMMPMGGFAGLGAAAAGAGVGAAARRVPAGPRTGPDAESDEPPELTRAEYDALARRAAALHMSLPGAVGSWVQVAVGVGEHPQTGRTVVIATSDPVPYLRRGMSIRSGEELVGDGRAPEIALLHHMQSSGVTPLAVASASPPSAQARAAIAASGAALVAAAARSSRGVAGP